jgi:hypothetical protein
MRRLLATIIILLGMYATWRNDHKDHRRIRLEKSELTTILTPYYFIDSHTNAIYCVQVNPSTSKMFYKLCSKVDEAKQPVVLQ